MSQMASSWATGSGAGWVKIQVFKMLFAKQSLSKDQIQSATCWFIAHELQSKCEIIIIIQWEAENSVHVGLF